MSFNTLREEFVSLFAHALASQSVPVEPHDGRVDDAEVRRWATRAPIGFVSLLGASPSGSGEVLPKQVTVNLQWALSLVAKDTSTGKRGLNCLEMTDPCLKAFRRDTHWTDICARAVTDIQATNLYAKGLENTGVAIWVISWKQLYDLYDP